MYEQIKNMSMQEQIETIARSLVAIKSINGTTGETQIAEYIEGIVRSFPYFQKHPSTVWTQHLAEDPLGRKNVFAFLEANKSSRKTVIYHAHLDTVGIEDYGNQRDMACKPNALEQFFASYDEAPDVQQDARSGDWMFGRGALDMKSGIAVHLTNLLHFSQELEQLEGNLLVMFNPVEENQHTGIIEAVQELKRLKEEKNLSYVIGINNDFISPLYDGDTNRYIYTGAVGKLLPCFYIRGKEAHVGQTLTGIDPTLISSEINCRINNNMELAEDLPQEVVLPPTCLYQRDQKDFYNVQTAGKSYLYFNYFLYRSSPLEIMDTLKQVAEDACRDIEERLGKQYKKYLEIAQLPEVQLSWKVDVLSYKELIVELKAKGIDTDAIVKSVMQTYTDLEPRMLCFKIIEALEESDVEKKARVIVFYAPPYCPHNFLKEDDEVQKERRSKIQNVLQEVGEMTNESFVIKNFFPYLSDSSYLSLHETEEEVNALIDNFPEWEKIYPVPLKEIRELNIPSINIGVYGKDAHQWTERIYKPYSYTVLPMLIQNVTKAMLA